MPQQRKRKPFGSLLSAIFIRKKSQDMLEMTLPAMPDHKIKPEGCEYLDERKLPALVLATLYKQMFTNPKDWQPIAHQT